MYLLQSYLRDDLNSEWNFQLINEITGFFLATSDRGYYQVSLFPVRIKSQILMNIFAIKVEGPLER